MHFRQLLTYAYHHSLRLLLNGLVIPRCDQMKVDIGHARLFSLERKDRRPALTDSRGGSPSNAPQRYRSLIKLGVELVPCRRWFAQGNFEVVTDVGSHRRQSGRAFQLV